MARLKAGLDYISGSASDPGFEPRVIKIETSPNSIRMTNADSYTQAFTSKSLGIQTWPQSTQTLAKL